MKITWHNEKRKIEETNMRRIYIAGKLNADACGYLKNCHDMIKVANEVRKLGHAVFVPCFDLLAGIVDGKMEYRDYADNNMAWLEASDAVLVLPNSENSKGTQAEIARARELGIPIFESLEELTDGLQVPR